MAHFPGSPSDISSHEPHTGHDDELSLLMSDSACLTSGFVPEVNLHVGSGGRSSARIRYVAQSGLDKLEAKLQKGIEITREEVVKLVTPEHLPDEALVIALEFGPASDEDELSDLLKKHGPRGAVQRLVAARQRAQAGGMGESISAGQSKAIEGEFDSAFKPLVLAYVLSNASGALLASVSSRAPVLCWLLAALPRLLLEQLLWSSLLFGAEPAGSDKRWAWRWGVRTACLVADALIIVSSLSPDWIAKCEVSEVGPATDLSCHLYAISVGVSDSVCLWLGAFYYLYRRDLCMRRLGLALFLQGFAFQVAASAVLGGLARTGAASSSHRHEAEEDEVQAGGEPRGALAALSTVMLMLRPSDLWPSLFDTLARCGSCMLLVPVFGVRGLDLRAQQPSALASKLLFFTSVGTALSAPLIAWLRGRHLGVFFGAPVTARVIDLPAYRLSSSILAVLLFAYAVQAYGLLMARQERPSLLGAFAASRTISLFS